jgi:hypothetical protein
LNLNDNNFYYNDLTHTVTNDILQGLNCGINLEQLHYYWPYKKIKLVNEEEYFNLTYHVSRIKKDKWKGNDIRGSSGPDYCGYPHIELEFLYKERKWIKNHDYKFGSVINIVAHELHHIAQNIQHFSIHGIEDIPRHMRENPYVKYFLNPYEVEAYHVGFRAESAMTGKAILTCIENFLENYLKINLINKKEFDIICVNWLNVEVKLVEVKK